MALDVEGLTVVDLVETQGEIVNPNGTDPLMVSALLSVSGGIQWSDFDLDVRAARLVALTDALAVHFGLTGSMVSGMGSPESPDNPLLGRFTWTVRR